MSDLPAIIIFFALEAYKWAIIIRIIISFLPMLNVQIDVYHPAIQFLYNITEPVLQPLRQYLTISMFDLSPLVVLMVIEIIQQTLTSNIR